jgi:hypothetical protein
MKGEPKNISEGGEKPPAGAKILWRRTRKIRGALRNILRNKPFLQCCPIAIYRDRPLSKSQETVVNANNDQQISYDVSRVYKEKVSCTNHCKNVKTTNVAALYMHKLLHEWM